MKTVILAGGSGTRLWPLSREYYPKQFIKFVDRKKTLFQLTVERARLLSSPSDIYIVTNERQKFMAIDQVSELGIKIPENNVIAEPVPRNTLPAICYAVLQIAESGSAKVAVLPSDHLVKVGREYRKAFKCASKLADNYLVTFGISPSHPHTGYGYIKPGKVIEGAGCEAYTVDKFVEKPDEDRAKKYIEEGYMWNSGMFLFSTDVFIEECEKYAPDVINVLRDSGIEGYGDVREISIDHGLMEKTDRASVVKLNTFWNDVGSFDALYEVMEKDSAGNAKSGECITVDSSNNLIYSERLVAAVGIENSIVVDTKDALLICSRGLTQKVKDVVRILKENGDRRADMHLTVYRPWGSHTLLEESDFYRIKKMTILPERGLSMRMHYHRNEHWVVVRGMAKVIMQDREFYLRSGESMFVPAGTKYKIENPGKISLELLEVQIGEYLGEDDIVLFED
jgi:mannose-1-phosphate guanylyltransferase/mannose-6-phosphate isomerase